MRRRLFILGSTGSIGVNTLRVIDHLNEHTPKTGISYEVVGLSAKSRFALLGEQIRRYRPSWVSIEDATGYRLLKEDFPNTVIHQRMMDALQEGAFDVLINSVVGSRGLEPTMYALERGIPVALANKETLVIGGELVMQAARKHKASLIPIDSEHSALMLLLRDKKPHAISRLILTASGGPFFKRSIPNPSPQEVLNHPTWNMGAKISVDSATMLNKGFEVIEAHHLFEFPYEAIEVVIHPESYVHSLVETIDHELYAQIGPTDMRLPIQNALTWPDTVTSPLTRFDLTKASPLHFYGVDTKKYPLLETAITCAKEGGLLPTVLNAANEVAVKLFLEKKITYEKIFLLIHDTISSYSNRRPRDIEDVIQVDTDIQKSLLSQFSALRNNETNA